MEKFEGGGDELVGIQVFYKQFSINDKLSQVNFINHCRVITKFLRRR